MRAHHVVAIVTVLVVGVAVKQLLFPPKQAKAGLNAVTDTATMDIRALQATIDVKSLPEYKMLSAADPDLEADAASPK